MTTSARPDLAAELARRHELDQQARAFDPRGDEPTEAELERMRQVDEANTAWLDEVVTEHGWPGFRLVGESTKVAGTVAGGRGSR